MALDDPQEGMGNLLSFLQSEEVQSVDTRINDQIAVALDFYQGLPFGDEQEGRSQLVTRDVSETVDQMTISILRTMITGDRVIQFEARSQEDTQAADDASELIQFDFMRSQDGYRILHDWLKAGLLEKTGVVKSWVENRTKPVVVEVPEEAFQEGESGALTIDGNKVVGQPEHLNPDEMIDDGSGVAMPAPPVYRATVRQPLPPKFLDAVVPNEEFGASPDAKDLDSAPYLYHSQQKTLSELHELGFEFDDDGLWGDNAQAQVISDARDANRSRKDDMVQRRGAVRKVWYREEYAFYDLNGDGIAERIYVCRVGRTILTRNGKPAIEEIDEQPFEEWCPFPMTSRRVGQSLADKTMDIQRVRSVMLRQGMDSLYLSTNPRTLLSEDSISENTIDDILTVRSGGLIRFKGATVPQPWATLPVHEQAFQAMEMMSNERESRTGITRLNQGLDVDTFDRTATGTALMQAAGQQMQEYCGRNFAEAFRRLAMKKYRMMRRYGQPVQVQVDGQFRTIDPRSWPEEIDIQVRVGLGTGNRDKQQQDLGTLLETQVEGIQNGSPLVTWQNVYNTSRKLIALMQIGNPSDYVTQPPKPDPNAPPKPDPEAIRAQGEAQAQQTKVQSDHEQAMAKLTLQQQAQQADAALKAQANDQNLSASREKTALDMQLAREKAAFEASLATQQQNFEMSLAERRFQFDQEMARQKREQADESDSNVTSYRPGGSLDQ